MQTRSEETRSRLLEAGMREFSRQGFVSASVSEICSTAGVSKGAFYHHFESKHALFLALMESWLAALDHSFQQARLKFSSVPEAVMQMARSAGFIFGRTDVRLSLLLEFWIQAQHDPTIWQAAVEPYRRYQRYFSSLVKTGVEAGEFQPVNPETAARLLVGLALGLLMQALFDPGGAHWSDEVVTSVDLVMHCLKSSEL